MKSQTEISPSLALILSLHDLGDDKTEPLLGETGEPLLEPLHSFSCVVLDMKRHLLVHSERFLSRVARM